jgi:hypothetical protein
VQLLLLLLLTNSTAMRPESVVSMHLPRRLCCVASQKPMSVSPCISAAQDDLVLTMISKGLSEYDLEG